MGFQCNVLQRSSRLSRQDSTRPLARVGIALTRSHPYRNLKVCASQAEPSQPPSTGKKPSKFDEDAVDWTGRGVPVYLQNSIDIDVCGEESQALTMGQAGDLLWKAIRSEAQADAASEPLLSSFLYASILAHNSFELSLAFVLANRLANSTMLPTQLFEIFHGVLSSEPEVRCAALSDIAACRERDPACAAYSQALLYYKGYHALQTQRIAHALWCRGQKVMALALQSRISEVFAVDIHPAARIGKGVLLDHGTGVVIGETAVIGNNVSILQNVTLGGTGKEIGDRHPKVGDNVLIGACATILGNITIGKGAQIAAGSLVLKPVPPHTLVAGSPAKEVGPVVGNPALSMRHWSQRLMLSDSGAGAATVTSTTDSTRDEMAGSQAESDAVEGRRDSSNGTSASVAINSAREGNGNGKVSTAASGGAATNDSSVVAAAAVNGASSAVVPPPVPAPVLKSNANGNGNGKVASGSAAQTLFRPSVGGAAAAGAKSSSSGPAAPSGGSGKAPAATGGAVKAGKVVKQEPGRKSEGRKKPDPEYEI